MDCCDGWWCITLISAMLALVFKEANGLIVFLGFMLPISIFWLLDAYFLRLEKMYRKMYEWVIEERPKGNDKYSFDLDPKRFESEVCSLLDVAISDTILPIYGIPFTIASVAEFYFIIKNCCCCCCC